MEKGMISERQFTILAAITIIGDSLLVMPGMLASVAKQDAWLSALLSLLLGLLVTWLFCMAAKCYPKLNLIASLQKVYGNWLGALLAIIFLFHSLMTSGVVLREAGDFIQTHSLPKTPTVAVLLLFLVIIVMAIKLRLEAFSRTAELLFGVFIVFFVFVSIALLPQIQLKELQPFFQNGFMPIMRGGLIGVTFSFVEVSALLMIAPYVAWNDKKMSNKRFLTGALLGGIVLLFVTFYANTVLGPLLTERQMYPTYTLAKRISIGNFLERLEALLAFMWVISNYFKIVLHAYALATGLAQLLRMKDYSQLAFPVALLVVATALIIYPNIIFFNTELTRTYPLFDLTIALGIPMLLVIGALFRKGASSILKL